MFLHQEIEQVDEPEVEDYERRVGGARVPLRDERGGHADRQQRLQRELGRHAPRVLRADRMLPVRVQVQ